MRHDPAGKLSENVACPSTGSRASPALEHTLDALSPLAILARGYAVAQTEAGRVVRHTAQLPPGEPFRLRLADGSLRARSEGAAEEGP